MIVQSDSDSTSICSYDVRCHGDSKNQRPSSTTYSLQDQFDDAMNGGATSTKSHMQAAELGLDNSKGFKFYTSDQPARGCSATPTDSASISSFGSTSDLDRHKRLESIVVGERDEMDDGGEVLEVIRIKGKKSKKTPGGEKNKKTRIKSKSDSIAKVSSKKTSKEQHRLSDKGELTYISETSCEMNQHKDSIGSVGFHGKTNSVNQDQDSNSLDISQFNNESGKLSSSYSSAESRLLHGMVSVSESTGEGNKENISRKETNTNDDTSATESPSNTNTSAFSEIEKRIAALCGIDDNFNANKASDCDVNKGNNNTNVSKECSNVDEIVRNTTNSLNNNQNYDNHDHSHNDNNKHKCNDNTNASQTLSSDSSRMDGKDFRNSSNYYSQTQISFDMLSGSNSQTDIPCHESNKDQTSFLHQNQTADSKPQAAAEERELSDDDNFDDFYSSSYRNNNQDDSGDANKIGISISSSSSHQHSSMSGSRSHDQANGNIKDWHEASHLQVS